MSNNQAITLDGSSVVYATEFIKVSETGTSSIQQDFATKTYVENEISNINIQAGGITQQDLDDAVNPIIAQNAGQDLVITDINNNLTNNFQTTTQLNSNFYNKTQVDSAVAVVDGKALDNFNGINSINTNLTNNYKNNTQLNNDYYTKTQIDANNWINATALAPYATTSTLTTDYLTSTQIATSYYTKTQIDANNWINATALAPYATTSTLTTDYLTSTQIATSYYNKSEVDGLIAGVSGGGGGVSNPIELVDANTSIERYTNATKSNISLDLRTDQEAIRLVLGGASDGDTDTYLECNNNTGATMIHKPLWLKSNINMDGSLMNLFNNDGIEFFKATTDASNVVRIKNSQGYIQFNSFNIRAFNTSNDSSSLLLLNTHNSCYMEGLGIGTINGGNKLSVSGGNSNFGGTASFQASTTFNNNVLINSSGRIYQQSTTGNPTNFISINQMNFSLQGNRNADPQASEIQIQLNNSSGITLNKATTCNETVNVVGKLTAENEFEVDFNFTGTPEFRVANDIIYMCGTKFQITNTTTAGNVERIYMRNNDFDGEIYLQIQSTDIFKVDSSGINIIGDINYSGVLTDTSDKRLKEDINEIDQNKAIDLVKCIKPKTYIKKDTKRKCIGFIANEIKEALPDKWENIVVEGKDGYLRMDYTKTTPLLWSALQYALKEIDELKKEVKQLSRKKSPKPKAKAKAKPKAKSKI